MKQEAEGASGSRTKPAADCLDTLKEKEEETPARPARQQSRAPPGSPHAANHRKERSGVTSSAGDITGFHHPVMPPLPP